MDGTPTNPAGPGAPGAQGAGARDPWALLLEIRNEQRVLRRVLETLLHTLGIPGAEPHPRLPPHGPGEARREARGLAILQRALARREQPAGQTPPSDAEDSPC